MTYSQYDEGEARLATAVSILVADSVSKETLHRALLEISLLSAKDNLPAGIREDFNELIRMTACKDAGEGDPIMATLETLNHDQLKKVANNILNLHIEMSRYMILASKP